jgi:hypothetical protein
LRLDDGVSGNCPEKASIEVVVVMKSGRVEAAIVRCVLQRGLQNFLGNPAAG